MELYTMNAAEMAMAKVTGSRFVRIMPTTYYTLTTCFDCGLDTDGDECQCEEEI